MFILLASVCNMHSDNMNILICTVNARVVILSDAFFVFLKFWSVLLDSCDNLNYEILLMFSVDTFHHVRPNFLLITVAVHLLGPHILQINLYCNTVGLCSSLLVRHQDPNSHKIPTVCVIIPIYVLPRWWGSSYCIFSFFAKRSLFLVRNQGSDSNKIPPL